MSFILTEYNPI